MYGNTDMIYKLKTAPYLDMRSTHEVNDLVFKILNMFQLLQCITNLNLYREHIESIKFNKTVYKLSENEDFFGPDTCF